MDSLSLAGLGLGYLPDALSTLTGLHRLDLSDNRLTELPEWIGQLSELRELLIGGNLLIRLPDSIRRLTRLTRLDVSDNRLVECPGGLAALPLLFDLDLSDNEQLLVPPPSVVRLGSEAVLGFLRGYNPSTEAALPSLPFEADQPGGRGLEPGANQDSESAAQPDLGSDPRVRPAVAVPAEPAAPPPERLAPPDDEATAVLAEIPGEDDGGTATDGFELLPVGPGFGSGFGSGGFDGGGAGRPQGPTGPSPRSKKRRRLLLATGLLVLALVAVLFATANGADTGSGDGANGAPQPGGSLLTQPAPGPGVTGAKASASAGAHRAAPRSAAAPTRSGTAPAESTQRADLADLRTTTLAAAFDNVGITADDDTAPGNFDGNDSSFSQTALDNVDASPGAVVRSQGLEYTFPDVAVGTADNIVANGQVIALSGEHGELGVLLADDYGAVEGTATVYYSDGSEQQITLAGQDWFADAAPGGVDSTIALTMSVVNLTGDAQDDESCYLFSEEFALDSTKSLYAIKLPAFGPMVHGSASVHVFALALG